MRERERERGGGVAWEVTLGLVPSPFSWCEVTAALVRVLQRVCAKVGRVCAGPRGVAIKRIVLYPLL